MPVGVNLQNDPFLTHSAPANSRLDPTRSQALNSRKQAASATTLQKKYNQKKWAAKLQGSRDGPGWLFLTGAIFPTIMFLGIVAMYTFDFLIPSFCWALLLVLLVGMLFLAWPQPPPMDPEAGVANLGKKSAWQWFPPTMILLAVVFGYIFGGTNYYIFMLPYLHYTYNREYTNVNPGENPEGFKDAGAMYFSQNSRVNLAQSVGFKEWNRYCVAPIIGDNPLDEVGFFAAGLDCCGSRHDFNCWESTNQLVHSGVRISENDPLGRHLPQFKKAAKMAASVYGFKSSDEPILMLWVKEPKKFAENTFWISMIFLMISGGVGLCGMCCCITGLSKVRAL